MSEDGEGAELEKYAKQPPKSGKPVEGLYGPTPEEAAKLNSPRESKPKKVETSRVKVALKRGLAVAGVVARTALGPGDDIAIPILTSLPHPAGVEVSDKITEAENPSRKSKIVIDYQRHKKQDKAPPPPRNAREFLNMPKVDTLQNIKAAFVPGVPKQTQARVDATPQNRPSVVPSRR